MQLISRLIFTSVTTCSLCTVKAQYTDSTSLNGTNQIHEGRQVISWNSSSVKKTFPYKSFVIPAVMIAYGFTTLGSDGLQDINSEFKEEIWTEKPHNKMHIDNYLQFAPAVAVYGLNIAGIKGKNNLRDRSMIFLMSNVFLNATVFSVKKITHETRPDGSDNYSFPSGHTAEAFASAEFLRQEYKDISPWYGIAGYATAAATGLLRMYNNKHWFGDIVAGAGVGIASTKLAYWVYPKIKNMFFKNKPMNAMVMPYYQPGGSAGVSMVYHFHRS